MAHTPAADAKATGDSKSTSVNTATSTARQRTNAAPNGHGGSQATPSSASGEPDPKLVVKFVTACSRFVNYCPCRARRAAMGRSDRFFLRSLATDPTVRPCGPGVCVSRPTPVAVAFVSCMYVLTQYEWWNVTAQWWIEWPHMIEYGGARPGPTTMRVHAR